MFARISARCDVGRRLALDTYYYFSSFELAAYTWAYNAVIQQVVPLGLRFAINPQSSKITVVEVVVVNLALSLLYIL